jgi:hypothetical protein
MAELHTLKKQMESLVDVQCRGRKMYATSAWALVGAFGKPEDKDATGTFPGLAGTLTVISELRTSFNKDIIMNQIGKSNMGRAGECLVSTC